MTLCSLLKCTYYSKIKLQSLSYIMSAEHIFQEVLSNIRVIYSSQGTVWGAPIYTVKARAKPCMCRALWTAENERRRSQREKGIWQHVCLSVGKRQTGEGHFLSIMQYYVFSYLTNITSNIFLQWYLYSETLYSLQEKDNAITLGLNEATLI